MSKQNKFLAQLSDSDRAALVEAIDESPYSVDEWQEALAYFSHWLTINARSKTFSDQVSYIACCIEGSSNTGRLLTLVDLVKSYVDTYGVH